MSVAFIREYIAQWRRGSDEVLFIVFPCREAGLSAEQSLQVRGRLERLKSEADEILVCLKYLDFIINNGINKQ